MWWYIGLPFSSTQTTLLLAFTVVSLFIFTTSMLEIIHKVITDIFNNDKVCFTKATPSHALVSGHQHVVKVKGTNWETLKYSRAVRNSNRTITFVK